MAIGLHTRTFPAETENTLEKWKVAVTDKSIQMNWFALIIVRITQRLWKTGLEQSFHKPETCLNAY